LSSQNFLLVSSVNIANVKTLLPRNPYLEHFNGYNLKNKSSNVNKKDKKIIFYE